MSGLKRRLPPDRRWLWVVFEGGSYRGRPRCALVAAPREGARVRVAVEAEAVDAGFVHVLFKVGEGDLVLAASTHRDALERLLARLGSAAAAYDIQAIPLAGER